VQAQAYILVDVSSGRVLAQHNAGQRMFPASTTKTMTALVALRHANLDSVVSIGPNPASTGEQSVYLLEGENFLLRDLLRAALIKSANDSCVAVAEGVAGTVPKFVQMMNEEAKKVGARHTHFMNPHGLHDPQHYTTAYDLSLIARAAMEYPFFNQTIRTRAATIHGNAQIGPERLLVNRNKLLFRWGECDGVKTGYTKQAGRCLIASATRIDPASGKPWRLLSVVLHSPDSWGDSQKLLMHHGFEQFKPVVMARAGEVAAPVDVRGGAFVAKAVATHDVLLPLRRNEQATLTRRVDMIPVAAPVAKGRTVGYLEFRAAGHQLAKVPLVAQEAVPASLIVKVVPGAASLLPSNPVLRFILYGAVVLAIALVLSIRKVRANERGKTKRRYAGVEAGAPSGPPAGRSATARGGAARTAPPGRAVAPAVRPAGRPPVRPTAVAPEGGLEGGLEAQLDYAARRRSLEQRVAARQLAERERAERQFAERQRTEQEGTYPSRAAGSAQRRPNPGPGSR
jgi:D-alanyl-D-alanine carboxypeptidase (penicillin-binding protein 5/6)